MFISLYLFICIKFVNNLEISEITDLTVTCVAHGLYCIKTTLSFYLITFIFTYLSVN